MDLGVYLEHCFGNARPWRGCPGARGGPRGVSHLTHFAPATSCARHVSHPRCLALATFRTHDVLHQWPRYSKHARDTAYCWNYDFSDLGFSRVLASSV